MKNRNTLLVLTVVLLLAVTVSGCGPASKAAAPKPERVVESFFQWYLAYPDNALVDGAYRSNEYLTEAFVQRVGGIIASFDKGGYDPFLCAQDVPESVTLEEAVVSGDTARIAVHTSFPGHAFIVALQRVDGQWRMGDVLCEFDEVSDVQTEGWQVFIDREPLKPGIRQRCKMRIRFWDWRRHG